MQDNHVPLRYPYEDCSREDLYRISLPYDTRIEALIKRSYTPPRFSVGCTGVADDARYPN